MYTFYLGCFLHTFDGYWPIPLHFLLILAMNFLEAHKWMTVVINTNAYKSQSVKKKEYDTLRSSGAYGKLQSVPHLKRGRYSSDSDWDHLPCEKKSPHCKIAEFLQWNF